MPYQVSFDQILTDIIGFGRYQMKAYISIGLMDFIDGLETSLSMLFPLILSYEWNLNNFQVTILGSVYFIGQFIGYILSAPLSDSIGRKNTILTGAFLSIFCFIFTSIVTKYTQFVVLRVLYGIVIGLIWPVSYTLVSEITPQKIRGRVLVVMQVYYVLGCLYLIGTCYLFMDNLKTGNWRLLALSSSIPCLGVIISNLLFIDESPRYLILSYQNFDQGVNILNKMIQQNNQKMYDEQLLQRQNQQDIQIDQNQKSQNNSIDYSKSISNSQDNQNQLENQIQEIQLELTDKQIQGIRQWRDSKFDEQLQEDLFEKLINLFKGIRLQITWRLMLIQIIQFFVIASTLFLLPFLYNQEQKSFKEMLIMYGTELISPLIAFFIVDYIGIGRITLLNISLVLSGLVLICIYKYEAAFLITGMSLFRLIIRFQTTVSNIIITESYITMHRATGVGLVGAVGRLAAALSPFIMYESFLENPYLPFFIYSLMYGIGFIVMITYPFDFTGRDMEYPDIILQNYSFNQVPQKDYDEDFNSKENSLLLNSNLQNSNNSQQQIKQQSSQNSSIKKNKKSKIQKGKHKKNNMSIDSQQELNQDPDEFIKFAQDYQENVKEIMSSQLNIESPEYQQNSNKLIKDDLINKQK